MNLSHEEAKWPIAALEALRIQAEQAGPSLAAKQAYINGLEFELRKAMQSRLAEGEQEPATYNYRATFNAIANAVKPEANGLGISVKTFWDSYRTNAKLQAPQGEPK